MREGFREFATVPEERPKQEAFERFFPEGKISETQLTEMPEDVQEMIEQLGMRYLNIDAYEPGKFYDVQKVSLGPDDTMYVARRVKEYKDAGAEESTFLVDCKGTEVAGYGEIRQHLTDQGDYFKDKPFVGFTETERGFRRTGLAERRLRAMNALARQKYGKPIYSDTVITESAKSLWEKLVTEGKAKKFKEGEHDRYVYENA